MSTNSRTSMSTNSRTSASSWSSVRSRYQRPLGELALHELLALKAPPLVILSRLKTSAEEAQHMIGPERYPLHLAIEEGHDDHVVLAILSQFPGATAAVDSEDGSTPLHLACSHGASAAVITALVEACPKAASLIDEDGCTPLHLAAQHAAPIDAVLPVHRAFREAAGMADASGKLPLHLAAAGGAPEAVVATLLLVNRSGSSVVDAVGKRAVDYVLERSDSLRGARAALVAASGSHDDAPVDTEDVTATVEEPASPPKAGGAWRRRLPSLSSLRARGRESPPDSPREPERKAARTCSPRATACFGSLSSLCGSPVTTPLGAPVVNAVLCH